jgi:NAD(P)-dependent dehydrogenase (short-subunit alcohol dehydrogenase family)
MSTLQGKRILIAGASPGGMGGALAALLVEAGAKVVAGDLNAAGLGALSSRLAGGPGAFSTVPFDIAKDEEVAVLVETTTQVLGGLDGLAVTVADLSKATMGNDRTLFDTDPAIWERTLRVNLIGVAQLMRAAIPHIARAGGGSVAVVSSDASHLGMDYMPAYSASKAGLQALVRHTARICGKDKVRCNGLCPGLVMTEGGKVNMPKEALEGPPGSLFGRNGEPEDIARVLAFLLSDESAWITGQTISANGGAAMRD